MLGNLSLNFVYLHMQAFASHAIAMLTFQFKHIKIAYQACMQIAEQIENQLYYIKRYT